MRTFTLKLDHLPPPELNPNVARKLHWGRRHEISSVARLEAGWLAHVQWKDNPPMEIVIVSYTFLVKDNRRRDIDNLISACKSYIDGLIDAGVIMTDDYRFLSIGGGNIVKDTRDETIIEIEEVR